MSKKIKDEQKKFLGETLNQYDKALDEAINQLDKKNREQNHKISSLVNSFDNEYLEKDVEGNMTALENSKDGMVIINEIQGSTEVNYCKDGEKELILNGDIDTQGKSFVTLTEGVDGGLVDVSLEGNTEVNLSSTKDPVLVTREFDDINCNVGKLQYTIDDVTIVNDEPGKVDIDRIVGDTMVNHAVNGSEELILNAHINESGDNSIKLNGVTSDGGLVDVALEGNTLVNVSNTKDSTALPLDEELIYLYTNTQYTVQFVSDKAITIDIALGGTQLLAQSIVYGINRISITTPSELVNNKLIIDGAGANISEVVVTDTDREFMYFEGMKSVGECEELEVTSANSDNTLSNSQQLTHEPLRAVGDVKDRYVLIDGKWYIERKCAKGIIDGTSQARTNSTYLRGDYFIMFTKRSKHPIAIKHNNCISKNYKTVTNWGALNIINAEAISSIDNSLGIGIKIPNSKTGITPDDENAQLTEKLLNYFQANPVEVVYQLETPQYEPIDYNPFDTYEDITHISVNSAIPTNVVVKNHGYNLVALKENTQYTLYVNKDTTNALTYRLGDYVEINSLNKFTFTTPSTLTDKTLRIDGKGAKVNDLILIEGIPTNDPIKYFDGLKSSYECEKVTDETDENYGKYKVDIKVVGKNLFDKDKAVYGYLVNDSILNNGVYKGFITSDYIDVKNIDTICIGNITSSRELKTVRIHNLDKNKKLVSTIMTSSEGIPLYYQIPPNTSYVRISLDFRDTGGAETDITGITYTCQIEEGNTATEYEPYFESKQTIYLNSPLLKGDEIVWKDNKIQHYHKMKTVIFDGSDDENIIIGKDMDDTYINTIEFYIKNVMSGKAIYKCICDKFNYEFVNSDNEHYYTYDVDFIIFIAKSKLTTQDVAGFKQWLQNNPTTVVYPLATPYYEEISDYPLKLNAIANSSLSTESTIQVTNISFNVYEETLPYLYPNTKYYITFNADVDRNNIIIDLGGNHVVFDCKVGFNKVEITTPSDTTNLLTFSGTGVNIDHVKVTQQDIDEYFEGMKSVGECEGNVIEITSTNSNNTLSNTQTLTHEPLRAVGNVKDRYVLVDGKWFIERNCGIRVYEEGDEDNYKTDLINTVYPLDTPQYEEIDYNPLEVYSDVTHIATNSTIPTNVVVKNHGYNCILKPSTTYTVALNKPNGIISAKLGGSAKVDSTNNIFTITTPSTLNDNVLRLSGSGNVKDIMILEKDKTVNTPNYFEGIESAFEQEYDTEKSKYRVTAKVVGKNLLNVPRILSGTATTYNSLLFEAPLKLKKGTYTISFSNIEEPTNSVNIIKICNHNDAKNITVVQRPTKKSTFTLKEDTEIDLVYIPRGVYTFTELQIEQGDEATSYEPYKESDVIFYINEPLRGVENNKDKVFIQDNKVVVQRNCASLVLNGDTNIDRWSGAVVREGLYWYDFFIDNLFVLNNKSKVMCDTLISDPQNSHERTYTGTIGGVGGAIRIIVKYDTQDFKQWLQQNPTTVVYQLAEPVYEEADCDLSKLVLENYENSSLIFESNIPVSANIRYSGEVPVVTQAKSLSSQVDNTTLDINENIIPYMCDIDYRIVELQLMNGDTQGEGIELLGIGDIEILSNENVLFNNREDKKYNYSYDMLKRDILSQRYSKEEYQYRLDRYLLANKISDEEYKELEGLLNNGE